MIALNVNWLRKLKMSNYKWTHIINSADKKIVIFDKLGSPIDEGLKLNAFRGDIFKSYRGLLKRVVIDKVEEIGAEPIFCNDKILVGDKILFNRLWIEKGVYKIGHFLREDREFLKFQVFTIKYGINTDYLT